MNASTDTTNAEGSAPKKRKIEVVGFGLRLGATFIDGTIVWFLTFIVGAAVGVAGMVIGMYRADNAVSTNALVIVTILALSVAYYVGSWSKSGQTIGKAFLGLRVVGRDGAPPSGGKAFVRYIGYYINALLLSLGFLWVAFDRKRQGWHDKLASTYVIYSDVKFSAADDVEFVPADSRPGWIWLLVWVLFAVIVPGAFIAGLLILGPVIAAGLIGWVQNLIG